MAFSFRNNPYKGQVCAKSNGMGGGAPRAGPRR